MEERPSVAENIPYGATMPPGRITRSGSIRALIPHLAFRAQISLVTKQPTPLKKRRTVSPRMMPISNDDSTPVFEWAALLHSKICAGSSLLAENCVLVGAVSQLNPNTMARESRLSTRKSKPKQTLFCLEEPLRVCWMENNLNITVDSLHVVRYPSKGEHKCLLAE